MDKKNSCSLITGSQLKKKYKGFFIDAGNTLMHVTPSVGSCYAKAAARFGKRIDADKLDRQFHKTFKTFNLTNPFPLESSDVKEREWWRTFIREVFRPFGGVEPFGDFANYLSDLFLTKDVWTVYPEVKSVLDTCKETGYKLAVISNWDSRLPLLCEHLGLKHYFDLILPSGQAGVAKPHSGIFEIALNQLGLETADVLHIGDSYSDDVRGAHAAGIDVVLLDRTGQSEMNDVKVVSDLKCLLSFGLEE